jgi:hypothetical protein
MANVGWSLSITCGSPDEPDREKVTVDRHDPPRIHLEIEATGIRLAEGDQNKNARRLIQAAVTGLQQALDSSSDLPELRSQVD